MICVTIVPTWHTVASWQMTHVRQVVLFSFAAQGCTLHGRAVNGLVCTRSSAWSYRCRAQPGTPSCSMWVLSNVRDFVDWMLQQPWCDTVDSITITWNTHHGSVEYPRWFHLLSTTGGHCKRWEMCLSQDLNEILRRHHSRCVSAHPLLFGQKRYRTLTH